MNKAKAFPLGISVIYFNDKSKNIYADLSPDKEQAKRLSKRIYKDAMTAVLKGITQNNSVYKSN